MNSTTHEENDPMKAFLPRGLSYRWKVAFIGGFIGFTVSFVSLLFGTFVDMLYKIEIATIEVTTGVMICLSNALSNAYFLSCFNSISIDFYKISMVVLLQVGIMFRQKSDLEMFQGVFFL